MSAPLAKLSEFPIDKIDLLRRTVCPDLTDDEMELFAAQCARTQLDPFSKQIHAMKRKDRKSGTEKLIILVGIDGFRLIAERTDKLDGQDGPYWCGQDGVWRDVWLSNERPSAAKVLVYRQGCSHPFTGIATWKEYAQTYSDGNPMPMWAKMGSGQLAKCAEALALRKGFPQELSGIYAPEEMEQADNPEPAPVKATPIEAKQPKAAIPPKAEQPARTEVVTAGDPITDTAALNTLGMRKGFDWPQIVKALNHQFKADYSITRTRWLDIPRDQREAVVREMEQLPDKIANDRLGNTAADLGMLLSDYAPLIGITPLEVFWKMCDAAKWGRPEMYDSLKPEQLKQACDSLRAKIAAKKEGK